MKCTINPEPHEKDIRIPHPEGYFDADIDITKEEWLGILNDPVYGKYWMEKAAANGFKPAKKEVKQRWK